MWAVRRRGASAGVRMRSGICWFCHQAALTNLVGPIMHCSLCGEFSDQSGRPFVSAENIDGPKVRPATAEQIAAALAS